MLYIGSKQWTAHLLGAHYFELITCIAAIVFIVDYAVSAEGQQRAVWEYCTPRKRSNLKTDITKNRRIMKENVGFQDSMAI